MRSHLKVKCTCIKFVYHILYITYMFRWLLRSSSGYVHNNTEKMQQTATLLMFQAISTVLRISVLLTGCIVRMIKLRRMRWAGHVACMGEKRGVYRVLVGKLEGNRPMGRPRRRWWIILEWISRRWNVGMWTGWGWPRIETDGGRS